MNRITSTRFSRRNLMKSTLAAGALALGTPVLARSTRIAAAQGTPTATGTPIDAGSERGAIVAVNALAELDAATVSTQLQSIGLDTSRVQFGVRPYQVVYRTIDPNGQPTTASELVVFPVGSDGGLRLVTWLHGTMVYRYEAASVSEASPDRIVAFAFASAGYAVAAPDYLGLGIGPGFHPYDDFPSTVTASADALRATRALAGQMEHGLDSKVLVTGFSQGGPSTMALGQALQEGADPDLGLAALAPISGPYDFSGTLAQALAGEINAGPQYLAYLMVAWNRLHHLYDSPSDAFLAPYDAVVEGLLDGYHTTDEVFAGIPLATPEELFTPQFLDLMRHPRGALQAALATADGTINWTPEAPITIYAASGDRDVPIANAHHAQAVLQAAGVEADLVDVGDVDHGTSVVLSVPRVLEQFEGL